LIDVIELDYALIDHGNALSATLFGTSTTTPPSDKTNLLHCRKTSFTEWRRLYPGLTVCEVDLQIHIYSHVLVVESTRDISILAHCMHHTFIHNRIDRLQQMNVLRLALLVHAKADDHVTEFRTAGKVALRNPKAGF
jgi:hypothetical protein